jgi:hypothetical protein
LLAAIPLFGIFVLHWSSGNIIYLFYFEFLLNGIFTSLRMMCAYRTDGCLWRFLAPLVFWFAYTIMTLFFLYTTSHLFESDELEMEFTEDKKLLYVIAGVYIFNFIFGFLFSGNYKNTSAEQESNATYMRTFVLIFILWLMVIPFHWISNPVVAAYILGASIILAKNIFGLAFALYRNKKTLAENL